MCIRNTSPSETTFYRIYLPLTFARFRLLVNIFLSFTYIFRSIRIFISPLSFISHTYIYISIRWLTIITISGTYQMLLALLVGYLQNMPLSRVFLRFLILPFRYRIHAKFDWCSTRYHNKSLYYRAA